MGSCCDSDDRNKISPYNPQPKSTNFNKHNNIGFFYKKPVRYNFKLLPKNKKPKHTGHRRTKSTLEPMRNSLNLIFPSEANENEYNNNYLSTVSSNNLNDLEYNDFNLYQTSPVNYNQQNYFQDNYSNNNNDSNDIPNNVTVTKILDNNYY